MPGRDDVAVLADGRDMTFRIYGSEDGLALIALHGTPGSRLKFAATDAPAKALSMRVIAPDRWGYGGTSPCPAPSLRQFAADIIQLADMLGLRTFAVLGVSGGGPFAAALAALHPDRVAALALVAPVGPIKGEADLGLSPLHRYCFRRLVRKPGTVRMIFGAFRALLTRHPGLAMTVATLGAPAADKAILGTPATRDRLRRTFTEGLRRGTAGPVTDLALFGAHWDIDLDSAQVPACLWLGDRDRNVPLEAARRLAERLPACVVRHLPGEGHLWVAHHYDEVLAWVADTLRTSNAQPDR
ncbi:MAG: alpha/beta fold hydrolase [Hyphomicrobiaceae bacterium]